MPSNSLLSRTIEHAARVWPLAIVPLVATLLDVGRIRELLSPLEPTPSRGETAQVVITETDRLFSVSFGIPRPVTTLWSFVNVQPNGISTGAPGFDSLLVFAVAVVLSAVISGLLAAGYLGSIDAALNGQFDFIEAVRSYGRPLVGFSLLEAGVSILLVVAGLIGRGLIFVVFVVLFVLAYLFFTTPYLVVIDDRGLDSALRRAYHLATTEGRILGFFAGYLVVSAVLSVPISALAFAAEPVGLALAISVSAPVSLCLNVATLLFVRDLVSEPASPNQSPSNIPVDM